MGIEMCDHCAKDKDVWMLRVRHIGVLVVLYTAISGVRLNWTEAKRRCSALCAAHTCSTYLESEPGSAGGFSSCVEYHMKLEMQDATVFQKLFLDAHSAGDIVGLSLATTLKKLQ